MGTPTYAGRAQTTYSCVVNNNCNYDVHVIVNYESDGHHGFRIHNTGDTSVNLRVTGTSTKPLILVFISYEPVRWSLSIPSGVVIDRVILVWKCANVYMYITDQVVLRKKVPYSGKFSRDPNFRDFRDPRPKRENKNHQIRNRENLNT